jgi:hypothetical protein
MSQKTARERKSSSDVARDRAALRDAVPAMITTMVLQGSLILLDPNGPVTLWYLAWSFSPLLSLLWLMWGQLRSLRRADEYQRVVQLEAMAIGFGAVILLSLAGGLLDGARMGDPRQSLQVTFMGGVFAWAGALIIKTRRAG